MKPQETKVPVVSVIVPAYNVKAFLPECLNSVLAQTFRNFEIVAINDGSTDASLSILQDFAKNDSRVKVVDQANAGLSAARNAGMKAASGKYVLFLDGDDFIASNALEKVVAQAEATGADLTLYDYYLLNNETGETRCYRDQQLFQQLKNTTFTVRTTPQLMRFVGVTDRLIRRDFLEEHNFLFPQGKLYEDHLFCVETEVKATKITLIDDNIYYWRRNVKGSITNTEKGSERHRIDYVYMQRHIQEALKAEGASDEMLSYYAAYFLEFAYMHLRWVKGKKAFFDYFDQLRMLSSSKLMHLASHIKDPRILFFKECLKKNKPASAYAFMKTTNQMQRVYVATRDALRRK